MQCCDRFLYYYILTVISPHQPFQKPHYLLPSTKLASLVKGRWIDGKAQTVALLRFTCDTPAFFNLPNLSAVKTEGLHSVSTIILIGGIWSDPPPQPHCALWKTLSVNYIRRYKPHSRLSPLQNITRQSASSPSFSGLFP